MAVQRRLSEGYWSSGPIFVLAVIGAAAGLGNVWRFPYLVGTNGGGAFLVLYSLCLAVLALPLLSAEIIVGRRGRGSPVRAITHVAALEGRLSSWRLLGWLSLSACCLLLATFSVVGGWALAYVFRAASGMFADLDLLQAADAFQQLIRDPERLLAWHTLFLAVTVMIVGRGVRGGIEEAVRWFMPVLLGLLLLLVGYAAVVSGRFLEAATFVLRFDIAAALSWKSLSLALGHAFYTLTLGLGVVLTYSAYVEERVPILRASAAIVLADTMIGLLAALLVFSMLFGAQLPTVSGPPLIFQSLPLAFGKLPNGTWFGTLFFLLLAFAAWTSAIALMEPLVAHLVEQRGMERSHATGYVGILIWLLGTMALLSFSVWAHLHPLHMLASFRNSTLFELFNYVAVHILLPTSGLLMAIFVGWRLSARTTELELGMTRGFRGWLFLIRFVAPLGMLLILADAIGLY